MRNHFSRTFPALLVLASSLSAQSSTAISTGQIFKALDLREGMTACEIGAGNGSLTLAAAKIVGPNGRVFTNELGEDRVKKLRDAIDAAAVRNVTVVAGGAETTNFPAATCDALFMRDVYHHLTNPAAVHTSIAAALRPGARVAVVDFTPPNAEAATPADRSKDGMHGVSPDTVAREMKGAGFDIVSTDRGSRWFMVVLSRQATAPAQPQPNPRQQPGAMVHIYAPEQHDLYDGHFVISANRIYMVGALNDPEGWDHLDNEAKNVRPVAGTAEIDVNEITNAGKFEVRLKIPEGDLVLAMDKWHEFSPCQNGGIVAYIHEHGTDSGCGDNNWPKTVGFLAGWGYGHATLNGKSLYDNYEMHFMVTQGLRDRKTLRVNYPLANKKLPGGETNPATQQIDFYIRSPQQNPKNRPNRQVFVHFFGMEITWK